MDYRTGYINGKLVRIMSEVWQCPLCNYMTNVVEDRRAHRLTHKKGGETRCTTTTKRVRN